MPDVLYETKTDRELALSSRQKELDKGYKGNTGGICADRASERTEERQENPSDHSRHRRLDCPSRPRTLGAEKFYGAFNRTIQETNQLRSVERDGFSQSSSPNRLTDEQREDLIAENIYDWWISGKSYKRWYADKFLQLKFDLSEDNET